jgi:hypothetical protein
MSPEYLAWGNFIDIMPIMGLGLWGGRGKREKKREDDLNRRFNAVSQASQVHSSGNYNDTVPI